MSGTPSRNGGIDRAAHMGVFVAVALVLIMIGIALFAGIQIGRAS